MNVPFSMISQKEEMQEANTFCVKHLHNSSYRYCEICQKLVCDKCIREEHFTHRTITITNDFQSNKYILQLLKNYKNEMSKTAQLLSQSFKNLAAGVQTKNDLNSKKQMIIQYQCGYLLSRQSILQANLCIHYQFQKYNHYYEHFLFHQLSSLFSLKAFPE